MFSGEQLSSVSLEAMEEVVVVEQGASSASAAPDCDDSLSQATPITLVESIDEALVPDIIAGTTCYSHRTHWCITLSYRCISKGFLCMFLNV